MNFKFEFDGKSSSNYLPDDRNPKNNHNHSNTQQHNDSNTQQHNHSNTQQHNHSNTQQHNHSNTQHLNNQNHNYSQYLDIVDSYRNNTYQLPQQNYKKCVECLKYNIPISKTKMNYCEKCYDYNIAKIKEYTFEKIGIKLNYLKKIKCFPCKSQELLYQANYGHFNEYKLIWNEEADKIFVNDFYFELWNELLSHQKCLRCKKAKNTVIKRPFCFKCLENIRQNSECEYSPNNYITLTQMAILRSKFNWLLKIGKWTPLDSCHFCNYNYRNCTDPKFLDPVTQNVQPYSIWYGKKRRCCGMCLEKEMRYRGFI
jgi:hypothetical protein